nr:TetR family transcriptional regulator [Oxalobacteraceae bacterium]
MIDAALAAPDIEGLSLRQVAAGLGGTAAAVYRHFRSREELLFEVAGIGFERLRQRFSATQSAFAGATGHRTSDPKPRGAGTGPLGPVPLSRDDSLTAGASRDGQPRSLQSMPSRSSRRGPDRPARVRSHQLADPFPGRCIRRCRRVE